MLRVRFLIVVALLGWFFAAAGSPMNPLKADASITPVVEWAEVITVSLDRPRSIVKKTDHLKIQGNIDGLVPGKSYSLQMKVVEVNGTDYSNNLHVYFDVEE